MLRIFPVELAAELETGSRLPTSEYIPPNATQLDSTCSVFIFFTKTIDSRRELDANSIHTARRRRDSTRQFSRVGVGGMYWLYQVLVFCSSSSFSLL